MKVLVVMLLLSFVAADGDDVADEFDICPDTPAGATIVDPIEYYEYAGCSCNQLDELFENNPCVEYFCVNEILDISYKTTHGSFLDCPEDGCQGPDHYDYPEDGFPSCVDGVPQEKMCEPIIEETSPLCYTLPELSDPVTIYLSEATLEYEEVDSIYEDTSIRAVMTFSGDSFKTVDLNLYEDELIEETEAYCGEDEVLFCTSTWEISSEAKGERELTLSIFYDLGDGFPVNEERTIQFISETPIPSASETVIIPPLESDEEFLTAIFDELAKKDVVSGSFSDFLEEIESTSSHVTITKEKQITEEKSVFTIHIDPQAELHDVTIIEFIPKSIAEHVDELTFSVPPTIIKEDPMIMWHFSVVDERVDLSYETTNIASEEGTTIVTAGDVVVHSTPWHIIIPLIIIPIIVIAIILVNRNEKNRST